MIPRHYHVACAIIERDGLVLAALRSQTMSLPLKWEFPGGKIEADESASECLIRELHEEMGVGIAVGPPLAAATHHYPTFTVTLHPFICSIESGAIILYEHAAIAWMAPDQLMSLDWAEADGPVLAEYLR